MIAPILLPHVLRAILDLVADVGGEMNDEVITILLNNIGHRVARRDVCEQMLDLGTRGLLHLTDAYPFLVARSTPDGRDVAAGVLIVEGISRHKTGE